MYINVYVAHQSKSECDKMLYIITHPLSGPLSQITGLNEQRQTLGAKQCVDFIQEVTAKMINSLTTEKQTTKFSSANFQKMLRPYILLRIQRLRGNSVDLGEVAHYEPPHQDLRCLPIRLFSPLVGKELTEVNP